MNNYAFVRRLRVFEVLLRKYRCHSKVAFKMHIRYTQIYLGARTCEFNYFWGGNSFLFYSASRFFAVLAVLSFYVSGEFPCFEQQE